MLIEENQPPTSQETQQKSNRKPMIATISNPYIMYNLWDQYERACQQDQPPLKFKECEK